MEEKISVAGGGLLMVVVVDVINLKNGKEAREVTVTKVQQDALGKVNSVKQIRRTGNDGLKINLQ